MLRAAPMTTMTMLRKKKRHQLRRPSQREKKVAKLQKVKALRRMRSKQSMKRNLSRCLSMKLTATMSSSLLSSEKGSPITSNRIRKRRRSLLR